MNIVAFISNYDGCGYYRIQLMAKYLNKLDDCRVKISFEYNKELIDWSDALVLQKQINQKALPFIQYARSNKKLVVYEVDDDYFNIPTWNPAHTYYQGKEEELINYYKASHAMTVSTEHLGNFLSRYNSNMHVIPNNLDFPYLDKLSSLPYEERIKPLRYIDRDKKLLDTKNTIQFLSDKKVIGWGGSATHSKDLLQATEAILQICREDKDVVVVMMACTTEEILKGVPEGQLVLVHPEPIFTYPKNLILQNWTVGICPVEDNLFNRSKSNLKYLEFSAQGIPCVCSDVITYSSTVKHMENGLLSKNTDEDWYNNIKLLLDDKDLNKKISENARSFVRENFDVSKNYTSWYNLYSNLLKEVRA